MIGLILIALAGLIVMMGGVFHMSKNVAILVSIFALLGASMGSVSEWDSSMTYFGETSMIYMDNFALSMEILFCLLVVVLFSISQDYFLQVERYATEHIALVLFALLGMICMVSFDHLAMLFLGIEIMSVCLYILAGTQKDSPESNEASLKYFLMGAFSTGVILMGITLIYGAAGSFQLDDIALFVDQNSATGLDPMIAIGMLLMIVGFGFKVSAVPFHFWTPDVYEGSPTWITALMSSVVKVAGFAAFYRFIHQSFISVPDAWQNVIWLLSALTMTLGSVSAMRQINLKRILAYSSIAHAGYMLMAILTMQLETTSALLFYGAAYSFASIAAFSVIVFVESHYKSSDLTAFNGLYKTHPFLAFVLAFSMISLAGIPLTGGFFAKFYILSQSVESSFIWLSLIGIVNAILGVFYYSKVIIAMYTQPSLHEFEPATPWAYKIVLTLIVLLTIQLGIMPDLIYQLF